MRPRSFVPLMACFVVISHWRASFAMASEIESVTRTPSNNEIAVQVQLKLRTGANVAGVVLDYDAHGVVVLSERVPYVFGWMEIEGKSACEAYRTLVAAQRGGGNKLQAADHFALGLFELAQGRKDMAAESFNEASRLNASYQERIGALVRDQRESSKKEKQGSHGDGNEETAVPAVAKSREQATAGTGENRLNELLELTPQPSAEVGAKTLEAYRTFGAKVQEVLGSKMVLLETEHFLIWTDWEERERVRLKNWCEEMYTALCSQLGIAMEEPVFLAKCPVFCFRSRSAFELFARHFDGHDVADAIGYTRSIEKNGHVHMAILRQGHQPRDFDRFACTLTHEGTHAFLHRLFSTRLIPHWVNEGFADLVAAEVMGDVCPNDGNARLLARQFALRNWPIQDFLKNAGPIPVHEYPLAHSVVQFLMSRGTGRWAEFIRSLKQGRSIEEALHENYEGMTIEQLESLWRNYAKTKDERVAADIGAAGR